MCYNINRAQKKYESTLPIFIASIDEALAHKVVYCWLGSCDTKIVVL